MPNRSNYRRVTWYVDTPTNNEWMCLQGIQTSLDFLNLGLLRENDTAEDIHKILIENHSLFVERADVPNLASASITFKVGKSLDGDDSDTIGGGALHFSKVKDGDKVRIIINYPILSKRINIEFWRVVEFSNFIPDDMADLLDAPLPSVPYSRYSDSSEEEDSSNGEDAEMFDPPMYDFDSDSQNTGLLAKHITYEFEYHSNVVQHALQIERLAEALHEICPTFNTQYIYLWEAETDGTKGEYVGNIVQDGKTVYNKVEDGETFIMLESTEELIMEVERTEESDTTIDLKDVEMKDPIWGIKRKGLRPPISFGTLKMLVRGKRPAPSSQAQSTLGTGTY